MKLYAAQASRAARQALYDVLTVGWLAGWVWLGIHVHQQVSGAQDGAARIEKSGGAMARHLHDAAGILAQTPLIGGKVRKPVDKSADAATGLQHAGGQLADNLGKLGAAVGFEVALVPVLVAIFGWLFLRIGYARRAGRAQALRAQSGGDDLLALEALNRLPARKLAAIDGRAVQRWRDGDEDTVGELASAYLRSLGLAPVEASAKAEPTSEDSATADIATEDETTDAAATAGD